MVSTPTDVVMTPSLTKNSTLAMVPTVAVAVAVSVCEEFAGTVTPLAGETSVTLGRLPVVTVIVLPTGVVNVPPELSVATAVRTTVPLRVGFHETL